jgi:hypothetical protein
MTLVTLALKLSRFNVIITITLAWSCNLTIVCIQNSGQTISNRKFWSMGIRERVVCNTNSPFVLQTNNINYCSQGIWGISQSMFVSELFSTSFPLWSEEFAMIWVFFYPSLKHIFLFRWVCLNGPVKVNWKWSVVFIILS